MQIETPVIEIDRSHDAGLVVADHALGMNKAGGVFVNPDARFEERPVIGSREAEHGLFIGNPGRHDTDVHAPFGGVTERRAHKVVQNEVRGKNIQIFAGAIDKFQINRLSHALSVERRIVIRLNN